MLAELGNIPTLDRAKVLKWVNAMLSPDDPEYAASFDEALQCRRAMQDYCRNLYALRKQDPGEDAISLMIEGVIDDKPVSAAHAAAFFELLLAAGSETTRTAMSHGVLAFAQFPDQFEALRQDTGLIDSAVEEILRWATPIIYFRRGVTADLELHGHAIKRGSSVVLCYASANRDERVFEEPFRFDIRRKPNRHLAFGGGGPHNCLGVNVARLELRVFVEELVRRVSAIELAGSPSRLRSNVLNGLKHVPVRLHPA